MAFVTVEDLYGQCEIIVFENCYQNCSNILIDDKIVMVEGRLSIREDEETKIVASKISEFNTTVNPQINNNSSNKVLEINVTNLTEEQKSRLRGAILFFAGDRNNIAIKIINGEKISMAGGIRINEEILKQLQKIAGQENVQIV